MQNEQITILGETNYRNRLERFGIKASDRSRHMYVIGQTGTGKSTLLLNMIAQDIAAGKGVAVIDPHGDLAEAVLNHVPPHRVNDVVYFNPADHDHPIGFNVLDSGTGHLEHLAASGLVEVFKKIWRDSWGPRLEYILRNAILALLQAPETSLLGIPRLLIDPSYRSEVLRHVKDPIVRQFWEIEYELYPKVFRAETISPIQNKVGQFLSVAIMRNILGQTRNRFNLREIMDSGKILIVNLAKGRLGEDNAALLGSLLVTKIAQAAMSRADLPPAVRIPYTVIIDEFQNFASESFGNILSEMRKYGLQLVLAHQYLSQMPESLRSAVFGNIGTIVSFRIGAEDGAYLEQEFAPTFSAQHLISLPAYEIYLKLCIDGKTSDPFSANTLPPSTRSHDCAAKVIAQSQERYSSPRSVVEDKILRWKQSELLHTE
jgi:hypothetical protein